jgi:phage terminase large subunit-like protein
MITFEPDKGKSPDRVDAMVWGFTELMVTGQDFWHV